MDKGDWTGLNADIVAGEKFSDKKVFVWWGGGVILYFSVNSYGHGAIVSSPNHPFFPGQA